MKERVIVSATTLVASLATYMYARHIQKDAVPFVMIGGFVGAFLGELIANVIGKDDNNNPPGAAPSHA
jgi:uncharacterized membrane protein YfcA